MTNLTVLPPEFDKFSAEFPPDVRIFGDLCLTLLSFFQGGKNAKKFHEWQKRAVKCVLRQFMPTIQSHEQDKLLAGEASPSLMGKMIGHPLALCLSICDGTALLPKLPADEREKYKTTIQALWPTLAEHLKNVNVMKFTLADTIEFSRAFSKALSCTVDQGGFLFGQQSDWQLLGFLIIHGDKVMELHNTTELHEALVRNMGINRAGDLRRIRRVCNKVGLRFPDKGGRPRKPISRRG